MTPNPFIPQEAILKLARESKSMSVDERVAAGLSPAEAQAAFDAVNEASKLVAALSVLSIGPEDTLLIKTPASITGDQLTKLTEVLQKHFAPAMHSRIMVIPHDIEVTKVTPEPGVAVKVGQLVGPHS